MLIKTTKQIQENMISDIIDDIIDSIDYLTQCLVLNNGKNGITNFKAQFSGDKETIDMQIIDNDWLSLDITDIENKLSYNFCYEKNFDNNLQIKIDYLRKLLKQSLKEQC